ncbi:MAG: replication-relaxation family protein [Deltaproteobacteria bacterium]|nr:replication-relaxation family protein [Deltaproteobacteria bacterium]
MTREQFAMLCRLEPTRTKTKFPIYRLAKKDLICTDYLALGRTCQPLLKLTETGHRQAAISTSRDHDAHYRDYVKVDFLAHLLLGTDLYLRIVAHGATDWAVVRQNASQFEWHASNEDTSFLWDAPAEFKGERRQRRVVPDVTVETESTRYLIEVERSTKTQSVVGRKIENYSHLFSPLRSAQDRSGYALKYPDEKKAVVVFVFDDERRAVNARAQFERKAKGAGFYIPAWKCGTVETVGDELRRELLGRAPAVSAPTGADIIGRYKDAIHSFVIESTKQIVDIEERVRSNQPVPMPKRPAALEQMAGLLRELKALRAGGAS